MARTVTLQELRTRAIAAADLPQLTQANWCPPAELNLLINDSATDLHDQLVMTWADYFVKMVPVVMVPGVDTYPLPNDFYKLRSLLAIDGVARVALQPFSEVERAELYGSMQQYPKFKVENQHIVLLPTNYNLTAEMRYVYQYTWLNADTDALSYSIVSGWDACIVYDVAAKLRVKAKQDASQLLALVERFRGRIAGAGTQREATGRRAVRDVYGHSVMRSKLWGPW